MATSTLRITGQVAGLPTGAKDIDLTLNTSAGYCDIVNLGSGANTVTVPSGVTRGLLVLSSANTATLTLKGVTGDTGIAQAVTGPILLSFNTSTGTTFVASAAASIGQTEVIWF